MSTFLRVGGPRVAVAGPAPARPIGPFVQSRRAGATLPGASYLVQLAGALRPVEGGLALRPALLRPAAAACARAARQAGRCCAACAHLKSGVTKVDAKSGEHVVQNLARHGLPQLSLGKYAGRLFKTC